MFAIIDTETTGLTPDKEMIAIAVIAVDMNMDVVSRFYSLVKPQRIHNFSDDALRINEGLIDQLTHAPTDLEVLGNFDDWFCSLNVKRLKPIGHNFAFDYAFLLKLFKYKYQQYFDYGYIDTKAYYELLNLMNLSKESTKLVDVCERLQIPYNPHKAIEDCEAVRHIIKNLLK